MSGGDETMAVDVAAVAASAGQGRGSAWGRLPTAAKMLLILSLGLLPLGIVAIYASIENAHRNRTDAAVQARALLAVHVQRLSMSLARTTFTIRSASDAVADVGESIDICARTLTRLDHLPGARGRYVIYGPDGRPRCASPGFAPTAGPPIKVGSRARVQLLPDGRLRIFLYDFRGKPDGAAEFDRSELARVIDTPPIGGDFALEIVQGNRVIPLRSMTPNGALERSIVVDQPLADGQYFVRFRTPAAPLSFAEALTIAAPILMWLWASIVGWLLVERLLLKPLRQLEQVVSAYRPGDPPLDAPPVRGPAQEIAALGAAFSDTTRTVAHHETELEAAVARQTRLVREVHHRVKNNLQVVASLLNIHSRGATNSEAAAYASIQRRVDALAVVHRNHYAEFESHKGVALKPLVSELAANLRATAPSEAAHMQIRLDVAPVNVTQDVAASIAFLITEVAEFGMLCGAHDIAIVIEPVDATSARIEIASAVLGGDSECDQTVADRFERIVSGLARQLRSTLERDAEHGTYSLRVATIA